LRLDRIQLLLGLFARRLQHVYAFVFNLLQAFSQLRTQIFGGLLGLSSALVRLAGALTLTVDIIQQVFRFEISRFNAAARLLQHIVAET